MKKIEFENWKRKDIFNMFTSYSNPYYNICFKLDVSHLMKLSKEHDVSFYKLMIYCISEAVNHTDEFLYVYRDGDIYHIDCRQSSYAHFSENTETLRFIYTETSKGFKNFLNKAIAMENSQDVLIDMTKESDELIHITCLPWIDITCFTNARDLNNRFDSVPKFAWGKYEIENDKTYVNMSLEVNHGFIDGFHIKKFIDNFENEVRKLEEEL